MVFKKGQGRHPPSLLVACAPAYFLGQWFLEPLGSLPQLSHSIAHFLTSCCLIEHVETLSIQWTMIYIKIYFYFHLNRIDKINMQLSALFAKYSAMKYCGNSQTFFRGTYCLPRESFFEEISCSFSRKRKNSDREIETNICNHESSN